MNDLEYQEDLDLLDDSNDDQELNLVKDMKKFREDPVGFLRNISQHVLGSSWRSYDDYVGQKLYYSDLSEKVFLSETLDNSILKDRIDKLVDTRMEQEQSWDLTDEQRADRRRELEGWISQVAEQLTKGAMATYDHKGVLRLMYYIVAQIFSRCYHQGVHVNAEEINTIKNKVKELETKHQSVVFLPCHKSHIDYMAIHFVCFRMGISLPVVVAGENLNIPILGWFLKQVGAMYIRRGNWSQDYLYQGVIQSFIETVLKKGYNLECFIEGTRSRSGKLLPPKFGILKYILDAILSGSVEDCWIAPVSTQYDKVVEANSYASELLGKEKIQESLMSFLDSRKIVSLRMGRIDIRFHDPWSLKGWIIDQLSSDQTIRDISFPLPNPLEVNIHKRLLHSLGYRVLADINDISVVMPTALVGTVLLTTSDRDRGLSMNQLVRKFDWLINRVDEAGGRIGTLSTNGKHPQFKNPRAVILNAIRVLGSDLVSVEDKGLLEETYRPKDRYQLSYYRNQVIHLFISESIVSVAIFIDRRHSGNNITVSKSRVRDNVQFLSILLAGEFVFKTHGLGRNKNFADTLSHLKQQRILTYQDDDDEIEMSAAEINSSSATEISDFYCYLLWPFLDGYWAASVALFILAFDRRGVADRGVPVNLFYNMAQSLAKSLYHEGIMIFYEAVNKEMLKVAFQHFEQIGILERKVEDTDNQHKVLFNLAENWLPPLGDDGDISPESRLYKYSEDIGRGRNRAFRHGITPATGPRVFAMCKKAAFKLGVLAKL